MTTHVSQLRPGQIVPVILSGGNGTRLWPVSRESFPKQFWPLAGEGTLIQNTALRAQGEGFAPPIVVCNVEHRFIVAEQLREAGIEDASIVLEPFGRNSAAAIAVAALLVNREDPDAVLWVMPSDAAIARPDTLLQAVGEAATAARAGHIVTLGVHPTGPETGYGYIEVGAPLPGLGSAHAIASFVEKPEAVMAEAMVAAEAHLWNSGMFISTAETLIGQLDAFVPEVLEAAHGALATKTLDGEFLKLGETAFKTCPAISFDHAVAEHTTLGAVVPAELGWSDVGNWGALWEFGPRDESGNVAVGDVLLENASNCLVRSDGMLTTVAGLSDVVVVVTEDAVLVTHRG